MSKEEKEANEELVPTDQTMTTAVEPVATNGIESNNEKTCYNPQQTNKVVLLDPQTRQWNPVYKPGEESPTDVRNNFEQCCFVTNWSRAWTVNRTEKVKNRTEPKPKMSNFQKPNQTKNRNQVHNQKRNISGISGANDVKNLRKSQKSSPFCQKTQFH